jgi:hypothetical protein
MRHARDDSVDISRGFGVGQVAFLSLFRLAGSEQGANLFSLYTRVVLVTSIFGGVFYLSNKRNAVVSVPDTAGEFWRTPAGLVPTAIPASRDKTGFFSILPRKLAHRCGNRSHQWKH